jgi:hypothetical protein
MANQGLVDHKAATVSAANAIVTSAYTTGTTGTSASNQDQAFRI